MTKYTLFGVTKYISFQPNHRRYYLSLIAHVTFCLAHVTEQPCFILCVRNQLFKANAVMFFQDLET